MLLALEDMPTGWTTWDTGSEGDDTGGNTSLCGQPQPETVIEPVAEDEAGYIKGQIGPFFNQLVAVYEEAGQAEELMTYVQSSFTCSEWTETVATGEEVTYQISPLSFLSFGDQTFVFRMSTQAGAAGAIEFDVVFVRTGEIVTVVFHGGIGGVDSAFTEEYTMKAVEKIESNR